jgi:hypothetical protein
VPWGLTYLWSVEPPAAGTITGPDTNATFTLAPGFLGNFTVKVRAVNNCGDGPWSAAYQCSVNHTPVQYTLSEGAGYCEGEPGVEITLDGSESGVNYELYLDNDPTGNILAGTGSSLSFGEVTETGIYTCQAFTSYCDAWMVGNTYIYMTSIPAMAATPTGSTDECNNHTSVPYETNGAANATSYNWELTPSAAGTITGEDETAFVDWAIDFTGTAFISVQGINDCGEGEFSNELEVLVAQGPEPSVSGDAEVCDFEQGVIYSTPNTSGNTYVWTVTGGNVISGAGTHEIQVTWGAAGTGYVSVTESNADGCEQASEVFAVNIDDCTGIGENGAASMKLFPNPAKDVVNIGFNVAGQSNAMVSVFNAFGQWMGSQAVKSMNGSFQAIVSLETLPAGIYTLQARFDDGSILSKQFVKSE